MPRSVADTDAQTIEPILESLIAQHGIERVTETLAELMPGRPWAEWQRVANLAANISRRLARNKEPK